MRVEVKKINDSGLRLCELAKAEFLVYIARISE